VGTGGSIGLPLIPSGDQALGILKHLGIGRAARGGLFLGCLPTLVLHLATIEAHRALSHCDFEILRRRFPSVLDYLELDRLTLIQSAQTRALDG
jgi:hypothetical protein